MFRRWIQAIGIGLILPVAGLGQERPVDLPPLLTPPPQETLPLLPSRPRGPTGDYDHGHLYLPHTVPGNSGSPDVCRPLGRWWVDVSFEFAWAKQTTLPGPVRLQLPVGTGGTIPGPVLPVGGLSTTQFQGGFGLTLGRWFGETNRYGVEGSFFTLGGTDQTILGYARGLLVVFPNGSDASAPQVIVLPPPLANVLVTVFPATLSTWFTAAEVNYRHNLVCSPTARLDAIAGYRFAYLQDELYLGDPPVPSHDEYDHNRATVRNPFHGGQVGLAGEVRANRWIVAGSAKVALGVVTPEVCATGLFVGAEGARGMGGPTRITALTTPSSREFAVMPTLNITLGRQIRDHTRIFAGYSFQYLSRVGRIGEALDASTTTFNFTDYWVQTLNLGLDVRF